MLVFKLIGLTCVNKVINQSINQIDVLRVDLTDGSFNEAALGKFWTR